MVHKFTVRPRSRFPAPATAALGSALGLPDLDVWRDYYIEVDGDLTPAQVAAVAGVLGDGVTEEVVHGEPLRAGRMVQVAHRAGIVDNESDSIVTACALVGVGARAGKVARTYLSSSPGLRRAVETTLFNPNIEELHVEEPWYRTLVPEGRYVPAGHHDLTALDDEGLRRLGRAGGRNLDLRQMRRIRTIQETSGGGPVSDVLLEALDARWSDHCAHTTWRAHGDLLGRLAEASRRVRNPNVVSMFHDNAGVWDFSEGWAIAIKAETHNGPSAVSAYFGQLTKLGGVLRDILGTGLGADPIGCFEYTATGIPGQPSPVVGRPSPKQIANDTIRAIREYGNTFGVPMAWSHMTFHPSYRARPFALGGSVGLIPRRLAQRGRPQPGDVVVLIGGLTGDEGIHGASASSTGSTMETSAVQIGAPLEEVKFRKAIVELRDEGCLRAVTDVGGAGLNSAVGEIGEGVGVWINTALVPLKTSGLPMWRILLSESQERMVLVVPPLEMPRAREILGRHRVRATVIGRFTGRGRYHVFHDPALDEATVEAMRPGEVPEGRGELGFDVDYGLLDDVPEPIRVGAPPPTPPPGGAWPSLPPERLAQVLECLLGDPELASQAIADDQYDSTVQGNTVHGPRYGSRHRVPSSYWAARPLDGSAAAVVLTTSFNPWLFDLDPVRALRQLFCGLLGRQVLAGVALGDVCVCDNFYTPDLEPHGGAWLVAMVDELARLVLQFGTPVISGKDSSAGSTRTDEGVVSVPPAVFLTALGKVSDASSLLPEEWQRAGSLLVRVGPSCPSPAGTVFSRVAEAAGGGLDEVVPEAYLDYLRALERCRGALRSGAPIGPGGVIARLALSALAGDLGVEVAAPPRGVAELLAEHRCGALVEIAEEELPRLRPELSPVVVGRLSRRSGVRVGGREVLTPEAERRWCTSFASRLT
jgi:phosphoribosylformylglycinamidine (FGAM) synthase-like enzyme